MTTTPLVSVICLCYNHERFVRDAINSVINQTYAAVELIVIDDASTDGSRAIIESVVTKNPLIQFIPLRENVGNCKAFNIALKKTRGDFIIDLAADDILLPIRIQAGVDLLTKLNDSYGVTISDAEYISEEGKHLNFHSQKFPHQTIPQGDIYKDVIQRFFISAPTVMFRRSVIESLGGYDEELAYEDFDFWVRSSRSFKYCYSDQVLVKKRLVQRSKSHMQYRFGSSQMRSTFLVCQKILYINKDQDEMQALKQRVYYELRQAMLTFNFKLVIDYLFLLKKI
ncbi:MAG TPA: glycosyltransferase [Cyclobacteriaceae bacterium]|nr:glycosyltransferase [Cyclobacteriaceae bacterium]